MHLQYVLLLAGWACCQPAFTQIPLALTNPWTFVKEPSVLNKNSASGELPGSYKTLQLDIPTLKEILAMAPARNENTTAALSLPMPDGSFQQFSVVEAPVMHPALAKKYPQLKSYAGTGVDDPGAYLRFDLSPHGFHAMVLSGRHGDVFIDPAPGGGKEQVYLVYFKKDFKKSEDWQCGVPAHTGLEISAPTIAKSGDCQLKTFRLALACTAEYTAFHGGTVEDGLAAINTLLTRVDGIFEREVSITMQLVPNNDLLVFTNPATDPYSNGSASTMLFQNQQACDQIIGTGNYDIGHVLAKGGSGVAYIKSACGSSKAGGVTGSNSPVGDAFYIDYVAHEIGHQFGANHTQNNSCNRNASTAVEPGSGSTIMSYAGICLPNIQAHSDAYFHAISLAEIASFSSSGTSCATEVNMNTAPAANAGSDHIIPKSTPFLLTGTGNDPDAGTGLTYTWEQMDNEVAVMPPVPANLTGPCFRSLPPSDAPGRYFPNLDELTGNISPTWEVLPGVGRTLHFRLTVRDNYPGGGCTASDDMTLTVDGNAGPFIITSPDSPVSWEGGSVQTVKWDVAGTYAAPVGCKKVDILLSLDGGDTWPVTLAAGTPNDGTHSFVLPNYGTTQARIMVKAADNIFFDISRHDFTIDAPAFFTVSIGGKNLDCFGDSSGTATVYVTGGLGDYTYKWSNGATTPFIQHLTAGTYSVTVTSGVQPAVASITLTQPAPLKISIQGVDATTAAAGEATVHVTGGQGDYLFFWSNGATSQHLVDLPAGTYSVSVIDDNGCAEVASIVIGFSPTVQLEFGTIPAVTETWQTVALGHHYDDMVVVASIELGNEFPPSLVTRVRQASGNSFDLKVQVAGSENGLAGPVTVHYLVAEAGVYTLPEHGIIFEAKKFTSQMTSRTGHWSFEPHSFSQVYEKPVVLGQVMSYNDPAWSVFWASKNGDRTKPPARGSLAAGLQIAEDREYVSRQPETIGYFVFETSAGTLNGQKYIVAVGDDIVQGVADNTQGYPYILEGFTRLNTAIVSSAGMDSDEGAWPVLKSLPDDKTTLNLCVFEDQISDAERQHTTEQVAFIAFGDGVPDVQGEDDAHPPFTDKPGASPPLRVFPNPAGDEVILEFEQSDSGGPDLLLTDVLGRTMQYSALLPAEPGLRHVTVDLSTLKPGCYFALISEGNFRKTAKIIKAGGLHE
ncbi:MAG: T9SS type A sorting domain-containing protein [Saprospiraceae bacterium]|nr:MAG: T9SS type A sorting domain-containing protein [Saprospiraceae bacterium]